MENNTQEDHVFNILNLSAFSMYDDPKPDASGKKGFPNPLRVSLIGTKVKFNYKDPSVGFVDKAEYSNNYNKYQVKSEFFINQLLPFLNGVLERIKQDDTDFEATISNMLIEGNISVLKISRAKGLLYLHTYSEGDNSQPYLFKLPECTIEGLDSINPKYQQESLIQNLITVITDGYTQLEVLNRVEFKVRKQEFNT